MPISLLFAAFTLALSPPEELDGPRLAAIISPLHDKIQDVELVWEGTVAFVDADDPDKAKKSESRDKTFQSNYAYRGSDGATYLDLFVKPLDPAYPQLHTLLTILDGKLEKSVVGPDQGLARVPVVTDVAFPGSAAVVGSPERILGYAEWRHFLRRPAMWTVKFLGWEAVDGHRCAHFEVDDNPGSRVPNRLFLWVDIERDGHILKLEHHNNNTLWSRIENVQLGEFPLPRGGKVWLPVGGEYSSFLNNTTFKATPVFHEVHHLVRGSVRLNQGLRDERFSIRWGGNKVESPDLKKARGDFLTAAKAAPEIPQERTDPEGVAIKQAERLKLADQQAAQLDASSPSGGDWMGGLLLPIVLGAGGVGVLVAAILLKRRG